MTRKSRTQVHTILSGGREIMGNSKYGRSFGWSEKVDRAVQNGKKDHERGRKGQAEKVATVATRPAEAVKTAGVATVATPKKNNPSQKELKLSAPAEEARAKRGGRMPDNTLIVSHWGGRAWVVRYEFNDAVSSQKLYELTATGKSLRECLATCDRDFWEAFVYPSLDAPVREGIDRLTWSQTTPPATAPAPPAPAAVPAP